jgi:hypothetical protein
MKQIVKCLVTRRFGQDQHALKIGRPVAVGDHSKMPPGAVEHPINLVAGVDVNVTIDQN